MTIPAYPLKQVIEVKQRRVDDAEKVVKEKQLALEKEQQILKQKEAERDKAKQHHQDKLNQMRQEMDKKTTTSPKIQQMRAYLKVTKERVATEEKKVKEQIKQVETAQKNLDTAKEDLRIKRQEVDKLLSHRKDWTKEMKKEQEIIDGREQDEIGSTLFSTHHRKQK